MCFTFESFKFFFTGFTSTFYIIGMHWLRAMFWCSHGCKFCNPKLCAMFLTTLDSQYMELIINIKKICFSGLFEISKDRTCNLKKSYLDLISTAWTCEMQALAHLTSPWQRVEKQWVAMVSVLDMPMEVVMWVHTCLSAQISLGDTNMLIINIF